jgi:transcriptional regulator with XRE-family HTH domain
MERFSNIEAERSRNGLSRTDLSEKLGVSTTTYKRYVDGISPIPSDKIIFMARTFNCSTDYLLGISNERI